MKYTDVSPLTPNQKAFMISNPSISLKEINRVKAVIYYWSIYEGNQWESHDTEQVTVNYSKVIVDTKTKFLTKNSFKITPSPDPSDSTGDDLQQREFIKIALDEIWEENNKDIWFQEAVLSAAVSGDHVSIITYDSEEERIKIQAIPSQFVFIVRDFIDPTKMIEANILVPELHKRPIASSYISKFGSMFSNSVKTGYDDYELKWAHFKYTKETIEKYLDDKLLWVEDNPINEIPIVHVKNQPNPNSHYGVSELQDIAKIQHTYNEKLTDLSEVISYHSSPMTIFKGVRPTDIQRGADRVWVIPEDADVMNLNLDSDLKAANDFVEILYKSMLEVSGTPEQAINPTKNVSNTPGVALHMSYLPLVEDRRTKILLWRNGIKQINRLLIKYKEYLDPKFRNKLAEIGGNKYKTNIDFGEALPRDESLQLANLQQKLDMGIDNRLRYLMEIEGLSKADSMAIINEADRDSIDRLQSRAEIEGKISDDSGFGKLRKPDPVVQGDKVSNKK